MSTREPAEREDAGGGGDPPPLPAPYDLLQRLSERRRSIVEPVFQNPRRFVLLTVRAMAAELDSDPATILRIVRGMGFGRYREFKEYVHELSIAHATSFERMSLSRKGDENATLIDEVLRRDLEHVRALQRNLDVERLADLAERMHAADRIVLFGGDLAISLVYYLAYHLAVLGLPCLTATTPGQTVHLARSTGERDLVIALTFGRGLRQTIEGLRRARANGSYGVGICGTLVSPIVRHADECFVVSCETSFFGESYAAPVALLNTLLAVCANARPEETLALLEDADQEQRFGYRWYSEE